ncbi:hypothetical protein AB5N19_04714 [Seiridium cardinale]
MCNIFDTLQQGKAILASLIEAKDPETGGKPRQVDLETEAFAFRIAGTHTTSATTSLLFYHLLHAPEIMARRVDEGGPQSRAVIS